MYTLGIETSCDETSAAIVQDGHEILSLVTASSSEIHALYGGVFPELACRRHIEAILPVIEKALSDSGVTQEEIDLIAVARGPGLIGALLIGLQAAKGLAIAWKKPWIGINHVEAHLYAAMMGTSSLHFPALGVVLSGGHTLLTHIHDIGHYSPISTTVDDALGEAFDKVGVLLGMPYPGGPQIEKLARKGSIRFPFKAGFVKRNPLYFSFSGIKTSVLYAVKGETLSEQDKADVAASFQHAAFSDVIQKIRLALETRPAKAIYLGGGVCNNQKLREMLQEAFPHLPIFWPQQNLSLDNAAMIAGLGYQKFLRNPVSSPLDLEALARTEFGAVPKDPLA